MPAANPSHLDLQATAKEIMQRYGFEPGFPAAGSRTSWPT